MRKSVSHLPARLLLGLARLRRGMTLGVRGAVFNDQGEVFLVRHSYVPGWYLPGGGVNAGETLMDALTRELMEEGGIILDEPARLFRVYLNRQASRRDHVVMFVSHGGRQVEPPRIPNLEIIDYGFFSPEALPEQTTEATRKRLAEIGGDAALSNEW